MKRFLVVLFTFCLPVSLITGCTAKEAQQTSSSSSKTDSQTSKEEPNLTQENHVFEVADKAADLLISDYAATSVQYALIDNGEIVLSGSTGNGDVTNQTIYNVGSTSKMYVTAGVMILVDQGKVDLDTPLVTYLPEFTMADERYKQITPRMLLNHSSGLYGTHYGNGMLFGVSSSQSKDMLLDNLKNERLKAEPGEFSVYCNDGFQLAEILIEKVSGMSYSEFIRKNISEPLGLRNTKTPFDKDFKLDGIAKIQRQLPDGTEFLPVEIVNLVGAGGIYSTAEEVCRFGEVLTGGRPEILSKRSAELMMQPEYRRGFWLQDNKNYLACGLGWDTVAAYPLSQYEIQALSKGGDSMTYHADLTVLPEHGISIAILSAGGSSMFNNLMSNKILIQYLINKGVIEKEKPMESFTPSVRADMPDELKKYSGFYGNISGAATITVENGELSTAKTRLIYTGDGYFKNEDGSQTFYFTEASNGETYLVSKVYVEIPGLGQYYKNEYLLQLLKPNKLESEVAQRWNQRIGNRYFCINELPQSYLYFQSGMSAEDAKLIENLAIDITNGYVNTCRIIDENNAENVIKIPTMMGRDMFDYRFFLEDGKEYMKKLDLLYIDEKALESITTTSTCTINSKGHAQWYTIDEDSKEKMLRVEIPNGASFSVYDGEGQNVFFSIVDNRNEIKLPADGFVVFAGAAGDEFKWSIEP